MRYFNSHIKDIQDGTDEIIDIQVKCNPKIFKFLLRYCTVVTKEGRVDIERHPDLAISG